MCDNLNGILPSDTAELMKIPGIGMYTASAISSIAFMKSVGVVDGNVIRVLSRLRTLAGDPRSPQNTRMQWQLINHMVDTTRPGTFVKVTR